MPKNTFYNLPENKRNKVIKAAMEEFLRAKNGDILIKNIVINAGIPRGSFYQYFESKEELVDFLMEQHIKETEEMFCNKIDEVNGDLLEAFECLFKDIVSGENKYEMDTQLKIMEHIKKFQQRYDLEKESCMIPQKKRINDLKLLKHIDKKKLKIDTPEELENIFYIIMSITIKNIADFQRKSSKEDAIKAYERDLNYLRYGIMR